MSTEPPRILLAPGANLSYAIVAVVPLPSSREAEGAPLEVGDELVALNASVPSGLYLRFFYSDLVDKLYQEVDLTGGEVDLQLNLAASPTIAPGDYTITIDGSSGNYTAKVAFTVQVVQYLVVAYGNEFSPANLTVTAGSTVWWLDYGGIPGPENFADVTFETINVMSPQLNGNSFDSFSYTFNTAGSYPYYCMYFGPPGVGGQNGVITVTN